MQLLHLNLPIYEENLIFFFISVHCKKVSGIFKLFPARESLVSDIPAGDGKTVNLFYSVALTSRVT